jgi:hypothetical protein
MINTTAILGFQLFAEHFECVLKPSGLPGSTGQGEKRNALRGLTAQSR